MKTFIAVTRNPVRTTRIVRVLLFLEYNTTSSNGNTKGIGSICRLPLKYPVRKIKHNTNINENSQNNP